ncbi:MAG: hypothetical protein Q9163_002742 [Psora crenata]
MELSPSKRRKTSLPASASNTHKVLIARDGDRPASQRASYMSPTKASLARFNPDLLPRSTSLEPRGQAGKGSHEELRRARTRDRVPSSANRGDTYTEHFNNALNGLWNTERRGALPFAHDTPSKIPASTMTRNTTDQFPHPASPNTPTHRGLGAVSCIALEDENEEPSLPSTPSQLGLEPPPEKPRGLLFHTPPKRLIRKHPSRKTPSPLKPKDPPLQSTAPPNEQRLSQLGRRVFIDSAPKPGRTAQEVGALPLEKTLRQLEERIRVLQEDLTEYSMLAKWHVHNSKWRKRIAKQKKEVSKNAAEFVRLWLEAGILHVEEAASNGQRHIQSLGQQRLAQFLPFRGRQSNPAPKPPPILPDQGLSGNAPFTVNISNSTIRPSLSDQSFLVRQDVELSTPEHPRAAKLHVIVDPVSQKISGIEVLQMVTWATSELAPWLKEDAIDKTPTSIGKAVGQYLEASSLRARCWTQCKSDNPALEVVSLDDVRDNTQFPGYGAKLLQIARSPAKIVIQWHIGFTNDGDVQNRISSDTSLPEAWKGLTGGHELGKIDEAFDSLVSERGVTEAIRVMVRILFPP